MCEVDFGVKITIDVRRHPCRIAASPWSQKPCAVGHDHYADGVPTGILIYLKASMTGGEDTSVPQYKASHPAFPHESTGDQFYREDQFESYRRLGQEVAQAAFELAASEPDVSTGESRLRRGRRVEADPAVPAEAAAAGAGSLMLGRPPAGDVE